MKASFLIVVVVIALAALCPVGATSLTQRVDFSDSAPAYSTIVQGIAGNAELWAIGTNTNSSMYRLGTVQPTTFGKAGGYITLKDDQVWLNPRVCVSAKVGNGTALAAVDYYHPISGLAKPMLTLSDSYLIWPVNAKVSTGPDMNFSWTKGKPLAVKAGLVIKARLNKSNSLYMRWNCLGSDKAPNGLRAEITHSW